MSYIQSNILFPSTDVRNFGAIPDCKRLTDAVATSGSAVVTSASNPWVAADVGKVINLYDFTNQNFIARTTILSFQSAGQVTMAANASNNLLAVNCIGYWGTDNATAINNALTSASAKLQPVTQGPNLALGGGDSEVIFPADTSGNMYLFGSQLTVFTNVIVNAEAMLVSTVGLGNNNTNGLANRTFSMVFQSGASIFNRMQMFCNYTMGIQMGSASAQCHTFVNAITLWDVGANFDAGKSPTNQISCEVNGNDYYFGSFWQKNGNVGLYLRSANDIFISHIITIGSSTGIAIDTCEEVEIGEIQIDTCNTYGISIEACHTVRISGNSFSVNSTTCTAALAIGQFNSNASNNLNVFFSFNRHGGDSMRLGTTKDSRFILSATNAALTGGGGVAIANMVNFTGNSACTGVIYIDAVCDSGITYKTGTGYGMFRLNGNPFYSVQAPSTGFSITLDSATPNLLLNPAGTLATGTIVMPANPMDGMIVRIGTDQIITALTTNANSGQTLKNGLSAATLAAGGTLAWQYNLSSTTWFRVQ